jgi:hypothetical protein
MKLYHVSPIDNEESILEHGLVPNSTNNGTCKAGEGDTLQGQNVTGVYGFVALKYAIWFAEDNRGMEMNTVFSFDVPDGYEVVIDPEYPDGEAMFLVTDEPVIVEKVEVEV